ncbi:Autophagy protein 5 [Wickerhamomyces ciferrii]|uniref:Autophagy protein 5 n=1 Tax=Wickerhamomyces ciferrii (strain ATCC 14091 / BCRC 22168 / CBS 111 / JCM 3599 / NBRC 0793 / NRRL Y-1031 F-60-10) TaxID=1206466 RepID=K0KNH0_WICCF|nr:Autophagy protein 5 [Wickerhamomyces ciferrii]CCH42944.1 Autophagy protein 5 [Wickerhamomyces ciferrii]
MSDLNCVWKLTLHYRNYPEDYLLPLPTYQTLESHWVNQLKESCYVQHGTAKPVMILSKQDSSDLWNSIKHHDYELFWSNMPKIQSRNSRRLKNIPIRLYLPASDKVVDLPVTAYDSEDTTVTLGQALKNVLPDLFPSVRTNIIAKPVLHGVTIPLETPLADLYYEAIYIDGFLHVSIVLIS